MSERTYQDYSHPLWRRLLLNRESAIIALLLVVLVYASVAVPTSTLNDWMPSTDSTTAFE